MADALARLKQLIQERERRDRDPLNLYEPLPSQERFFASKSPIRVVRGGNRSGKSLTSFIELARAARGMDPHGKYPTNRPLLIYVVGYDLDTIGRVAHRLLFRPGAFQIIRDEVTGKWRAYRPWTKEDQARHEFAVPAPPLIPEECIDPSGWAWENHSERIWSVCRLKFGENHPMNGTELRAFGSKSEPAMGDPVDIVMIDEDIYNEAWATEMEARLSDRKGRMWWCAFPLLRNSAMTNLSRRAEACLGSANPDVSEFILRFSDNPHIDEETKRIRIAGWSDEERRARDFGDYVTESVLMYPEFSRDRHGLPRRNAQEPDELERAVAECGIPPTWTKYMSVDPGHSVCAVLFAAIPPPEEFGDRIVIYDELYLRSCNAQMFAEHVAKKVGNDVFQAFIIDDHGSRVSSAGSGRSIRSEYSAALEAEGVSSVETESGFYRGFDNPKARAEMVRGAFQTSPSMPPKLRIMCERTPNLVIEFSLFKKRIMYGKNSSDEPVAANNHACNALEYLVAHCPKYQQPAQSKPRSHVYARYMALTKKEGPSKVNLGPPAPSFTGFPHG